MSEENLILLLFASLPVLAVVGIYLFFGRYRLHNAQSIPLLRLVTGNALVFLFLVSLLVLSGECYYRFWYDKPDSFGLMKTSQRWFERHYRHNKSGFRDNIEYHRRIRQEKPRVTFLGDSFTAGHGIRNVDDRFVNIIRQSRPTWEVHCIAKNGWDTSHQLKILAKLIGLIANSSDKLALNSDPSGRTVFGQDERGRLFLGYDEQGRTVVREPSKEGEDLGKLGLGESSNQARYELDLVVLSYCMNDVSDIVPEWQDIANRIYVGSEPGWLAKYSFLFNVLHFRLFAARDPDIHSYYRFAARAYEPQSSTWRQHAERLTALDHLVRSGGGRLLVVTFPFLDQVGPEYPYVSTHRMLADHCAS